MAKEATPTQTSEEEWEDVNPGLGRAWDFDKYGDLVGIYIGVQHVEIDPQKNEGRTEAKAHQVGLLDNSAEIVFVWGSHELDNAFTDIGGGDKVKVSFLGRDTFNSDNGPRQVKRYRVQRAKK
jgi:hypothetical protein